MIHVPMLIPVGHKSQGRIAGTHQILGQVNEIAAQIGRILMTAI